MNCLACGLPIEDHINTKAKVLLQDGAPKIEYKVKSEFNWAVWKCLFGKDTTKEEKE